jgi:hypothetical protein
MNRWIAPVNPAGGCEMLKRAYDAVLKLFKTGAAPEVEFVFGDAQPGKHDAFLSAPADALKVMADFVPF